MTVGIVRENDLNKRKIMQLSCLTKQCMLTWEITGYSKEKVSSKIQMNE